MNVGKQFRYLFVIASVLGIFLYGVAVGQYHIFPYEQLISIRNVSLFNTLKTEALKLSGKKQGKKTETRYTALHRLFIKEIQLQINPASGAYHLARAGNLLYVFGHNGSITIYDLDSLKKIDANLDALPMGVDLPAYTDQISIPGFSVNGFRVLGAYVEDNSAGEHTVYISHHRFEKERECVSMNLSKGVLRHHTQQGIQQIQDWKTIFTAEPCLQSQTMDDGRELFQVRLTAGGHIIPFDASHLLVSTGDAGFDGIIHKNLQGDPGNLFGKIILVNKSNGRHSIYASGLRNTQGMYIDANNTIWATDHGPQGGDELNIIEQGMHYGWPEVSYGIEYGNEPWPHSAEQGYHEGFEKPHFVWSNAIAPSEVLRVQNQQRFEHWSGDLLVATLRDQSLHRLRVDEGIQILYDERIELGHRIRDMLFLPNGLLALISDRMELILIDDGGAVFEESPPTKEKLEQLSRYELLTASD